MMMVTVKTSTTMMTSSNTAVGSHEPMPAVDVDYDDNRRGMVLSFF